jgi:hypothetical protein
MANGAPDREQHEVRVTGLYASYRGRPYQVSGYSGGRFRGQAVLLVDEDDADAFPELMPGEPLAAKVPLHELDGLISVDLIGRFAGREVFIMSMDDRRVSFLANAPTGWAREHGLQGSQHGAIRGTVPRREVEIIGEEVRDLLLLETRRKSKNL